MAWAQDKEFTHWKHRCLREFVAIIFSGEKGRNTLFTSVVYSPVVVAIKSMDGNPQSNRTEPAEVCVPPAESLPSDTQVAAPQREGEQTTSTESTVARDADSVTTHKTEAGNPRQCLPDTRRTEQRENVPSGRCRQEDLPQDFDLQGVLPMSTQELSERFGRDQLAIDRFIIWSPFINMPVYTSKLAMLITGEPTWIVSDSMKVVRLYYVVMRWLLGATFTRSRLRTALDWLCDQAESGKLRREDVVQFAENASTRREDRDAHALVKRFDKRRGKLSTVDIEKIVNKEGITAVKACEPSPWKGDKIFREDIEEDHRKRMQSLTGMLSDQLVMQPKGDYHGRLSVLVYVTLHFLRAYEIAILRLLSEASMIQVVPSKYAQGLATPIPKMPADGLLLPPKEVTSKRLQEEIRTEIRAITRARCQDILHMELPEGNDGTEHVDEEKEKEKDEDEDKEQEKEKEQEQEKEKDEDNGTRRHDVPSPNELSAFMRFLEYQPASDKECQDAMMNVLNRLARQNTAVPDTNNDNNDNANVSSDGTENQSV